eukprot:785145-Pyramimonas_sp.AAC.1
MRSEDVMLEAALFDPAVVLRVLRLRYFGRVLRTGPPQLRLLLQYLWEEGEGWCGLLRGDFDWLDEHQEHESHLNPTPHWKWFEVAREAPASWKAVINRATAAYGHWSKDQLKLTLWRQKIFDVCQASGICPPPT